MSTTDTTTEKPTKPPRPHAFYDVPANAVSSRCKCGATQYWIFTNRGKRMPVDCDVEGGRRPNRGSTDTMREPIDEPNDGRGVSHFATCPRADGFRKART